MFKIFDSIHQPGRKISLKIQAIQDDPELQFIWQSESSQISFILSRKYCEAFSIRSEGTWSIQMETLKECLSLLDPSTGTLSWSHSSTGSRTIESFFPRTGQAAFEVCTIAIDPEESGLLLRIRTSDGLNSTCKLTLYDPIPLQDMESAFHTEDMVLKVDLKSELIINALSSIDDTCTVIQIAASNQSGLIFKAEGMAGECCITFSKDALAIFELYPDQMMPENEVGITLVTTTNGNLQFRKICFAISLARLKNFSKRLSYRKEL